MEAVLEEMVRIAQTNPLPYLAIALVGVLLGLFARPSLPIALGIASVALLTHLGISFDMSDVVQGALRVIHVAMVVALISFAIGWVIAWVGVRNW